MDIIHSDLKSKGMKKWEFIKYTVCSNDDQISSCHVTVVNIQMLYLRLFLPYFTEMKVVMLFIL